MPACCAFPRRQAGSSIVDHVDSQTGLSDLWVKQLDTGPLFTPHVRGNGGTSGLLWSRDGQFAHVRVESCGIVRDLWRKKADGSGAAAELVLDREQAIVQEFALFARRHLAGLPRWRSRTAGPPTPTSTAIRPGVDSVATPLVTEGSTQFDEFMPTISPDGRWLAHVSRAYRTAMFRCTCVPSPTWDAGMVADIHD